MLFLAAGVRRSASTLVFQLACELAGGDSHRIRRWDDRPSNVCGSDRWWVAKSHKFLPEIVSCYGNGRAWPLVTIRDPRDITVSMMELKGMSFDEVMEWDVVARDIRHQKQWSDAGFPMHKYEDFVDNFYSLIWTISGIFGIVVSEEWEANLLEKYSFESNKARSNKQGNVATDLLFPGHLQTGEVGRWKRKLTYAQVTELEQRIGYDWLERWGYR